MSISSQSPEIAEASRPRTVFDDHAIAGARSYAEAFLNVAAREGQEDAAVEELEAIRDDVLRPHPALFAMLIGPSMGHEQKDELLVRLFEERALPTVSRFLRVLNRHGRLELFEMIIDQARAELDRRRKRLRIQVRSAAPLDDSQQSALRDRLGQMLEAEPLIDYQVDPALLGGLVIQVGDEIYDASVQAQLERLRREVVHERAHEARKRFIDSVVVAAS